MSRCHHEERKKRHKTITDWAWQMLLQVARWMPGRSLVVVADGTYAKETQVHPGVADFEKKTTRKIPVVELVRRNGSW